MPWNTRYTHDSRGRDWRNIRGLRHLHQCAVTPWAWCPASSKTHCRFQRWTSVMQIWQPAWKARTEINETLYVEWFSSVYSTKAELWFIHRNLYHLSTDKLIRRVRHSANEHITSKLCSELEPVWETCNTSLEMVSDQSRFREHMPNEDNIFNRTVGMDIMKNLQTGRPSYCGHGHKVLLWQLFWIGSPARKFGRNFWLAQ